MSLILFRASKHRRSSPGTCVKGCQGSGCGAGAHVGCFDHASLLRAKQFAAKRDAAPKDSQCRSACAAYTYYVRVPGAVLTTPQTAVAQCQQTLLSLRGTPAASNLQLATCSAAAGRAGSSVT